MARARTVAVVVPSPAMSLVFWATALTSLAPMFSKGSGSSISLLTVTPSLVTVGPPKLLSRITFRPVGPRVMPTACASLSAPCRSFLRASSVYSNCFAILDRSPLFHHFGKYVALTQDLDFFAVHLDIGAAIAPVEDFIPLGDGDLGALAVVEQFARTDGQ